MLRWGAAGGVLGAIGRDMADGAHVLAETVLHRQLRWRFVWSACFFFFFFAAGRTRTKRARFCESEIFKQTVRM